MFFAISLLLMIAALPGEASLPDATLGGAFLATSHPKFPCKEVVRFYRRAGPEVYHASIWNGFGANKKCYRRIFGLKKRVVMQFYLSNEACRRNGDCEARDLLPCIGVRRFNDAAEAGDPVVGRTVKQRARDVLGFCEASKKEGDRCLLALGLESNFSEGAARQVARWVIDAGWRKKDLVYNPEFGYLGNDVVPWYERHKLYGISGVEGRRTIVSFDGNDLDLCRGRFGDNQISSHSLQRWFASHRDKIRYFAAWCPNWQGRGTGGPEHPRCERAIAIFRSELDGFLNLWNGGTV